MSHADFRPSGEARGLGFAAAARGPCQRRDLDDWAVVGGALPPKLADHIDHCPQCADQVRRVNRVHASLTLMRTQAVPMALLPRANGRALRLLRKVSRASSAVARLLQMNAEMSFWQRVGLHMMRVSLGVAAAGLTLVVRIGMLTGFEQTRSASQQLAARYFDRQSEETDGWSGPRSLV